MLFIARVLQGGRDQAAAWSERAPVSYCFWQKSTRLRTSSIPESPAVEFMPNVVAIKV